MKTITVSDLFIVLKQAINDNLGDKKIVISSDDEGNSYHELFFALTRTKKMKVKDYQLPTGVDKETFEKEYVILG